MILFGNPIQWTDDLIHRTGTYMRVNRGGLDTRMTQKLLNIPNIRSILQQMRGKTVS